MSCTALDDLQDLAQNLFQFQEPNPKKQKIQQDRILKKHQKQQKIKQKHVQNNSIDIQQNDDISIDNFGQTKQKIPGTHNIYVKTFGCSHNISDSQFMIGQLVQYGYNIVKTVNQADLVLINSCTVKNPSQDSFINLVCKAKKIKKFIVVAGCVPQGDQNISELNQVSALGVTQIDRVVEVVQQTLKGHKVQLMQKKALPSLDLPKIRKNKDIEIIPINGGCLGACTYCKTVFARGKLNSYAPEAITSRVTSVVQEGVKQIWLTSEDTGAYGRDINTNISQLLIRLCEQLQHHDKIMIRLGMTNPPYMLQHLKTIASFLNHPRVYSFIHIPVQAGHNNVLTKMNREYTVEQFKIVCDYFIQNVNNVTIATDIICGFAQETDEEFQATMKLVDYYKFKVLYISQFYLRPGTPAANLKQLPTTVIKERSTKISNLFKSFDSYSYMIGKIERVWVNEIQQYKGQKHLVGHTKNYTKVSIPYNPQLIYKQVLIKITKAYDWHIEGQVIQICKESIVVSDGYVKKMRQDLENQKMLLEEKKKIKFNHVKDIKKIIMQQIDEGGPAKQGIKQQMGNIGERKQKVSENKITSNKIQGVGNGNSAKKQIQVGKDSSNKIYQNSYNYKYLGGACFMFILAYISYLMDF